jgi:hypothetical protein
MEFILSQIKASEPQILEFVEELAYCEEASKLDLSILTGKVQSFEVSLKKMEKEIVKVNEKLAQL